MHFNNTLNGLWSDLEVDFELVWLVFTPNDLFLQNSFRKKFLCHLEHEEFLLQNVQDFKLHFVWKLIKLNKLLDQVLLIVNKPNEINNVTKLIKHDGVECDSTC